MTFSYDEFDLSGLRTYALGSRKSKVNAADLATPIAPQAPPATRLSGYVVDAETGGTISGARVRLMFVGEPPPGPARSTPPLSTVTDSNGEFAFDVSIAARYRVWANAPGFTVPIDPPMLTLAPGQPPASVTVKLSRSGQVGGHVFVLNSEPAVKLLVTALRRRVDPSGQVLTSMGPTAIIPSDGEFQLSMLLPGEYVLVARPQSPDVARRRLPDGRLVLAPTYFPGTTDVRAATPISISPGQSINGLNFAMESAAAHGISGIVVDSSGLAMSRAMLVLSPSLREGGAGPAPPLRSFTGPDGTFVIDGVAPGRYELRASMPDPKRPDADALIRGPDDELLSPSRVPPVVVDLTVGDGDINGLRVVLSRGP